MLSRAYRILALGVMVTGGWASGTWASELVGTSPLIQRSTSFEGVSSVAVDPFDSDMVLAGDRRGRIWRSEDRGTSWTSLIPEPEAVNDHLGTEIDAVCADTRCGTSSIVFDPFEAGTIYLAKVGAYFRSSDGGHNWLDISPDGTRYAYRGDIDLDPRTPNKLYVTTESGIFRSRDGGGTWEHVSSDAAEKLAISPSTPSVMYSVGRTISRSSDGGFTWAVRGEGLFIDNVEGILSVAVDPRDPDVVYAGTFTTPDTDGVGLFKSTNAGRSWQPLEIRGHAITVVRIDADDPDVVYAGGGTKLHPDGLFYSADGGQTWALLDGRGTTMSLDFDPASDVVYEATHLGLYRLSGLFQSTAVPNESWGRLKSGHSE